MVSTFVLELVRLWGKAVKPPQQPVNVNSTGVIPRATSGLIVKWADILLRLASFSLLQVRSHGSEPTLAWFTI